MKYLHIIALCQVFANIHTTGSSYKTRQYEFYDINGFSIYTFDINKNPLEVVDLQAESIVIYQERTSFGKKKGKTFMIYFISKTEIKNNELTEIQDQNRKPEIVQQFNEKEKKAQELKTKAAEEAMKKQTKARGDNGQAKKKQKEKTNTEANEWEPVSSEESKRVIIAEEDGELNSQKKKKGKKAIKTEENMEKNVFVYEIKVEYSNLSSNYKRFYTTAEISKNNERVMVFHLFMVNFPHDLKLSSETIKNKSLEKTNLLIKAAFGQPSLTPNFQKFTKELLIHLDLLAIYFIGNELAADITNFLNIPFQYGLIKPHFDDIFAYIKSEKGHSSDSEYKKSKLATQKSLETQITTLKDQINDETTVEDFQISVDGILNEYKSEWEKRNWDRELQKPLIHYALIKISELLVGGISFFKQSALRKIIYERVDVLLYDDLTSEDVERNYSSLYQIEDYKKMRLKKLMKELPENKNIKPASTDFTFTVGYFLQKDQEFFVDKVKSFAFKRILKKLKKLQQKME
jgi:hypothetical protein